MKPRISVNILTWNSIGITLEAVHVLRNDLRKAGIEYEIIVVDNGSTDLTTEILLEAQQSDGNIVVISNKENVGISKGKNQGIDASRFEYIFMLDGDILPVPNSIICFLNVLETHPEVDILGARWNKFTNQRNANGQVHHLDYCDKVIHPIKERRAAIYYGLFRRYMFDEGLRLDEGGPFGEVGYGWEDHDFWELCQARGIESWFVEMSKPGGLYYHNINSSIRAMGRQEYKRRIVLRDNYFKEKWAGKAARDTWKPGDARDDFPEMY